MTQTAYNAGLMAGIAMIGAGVALVNIPAALVTVGALVIGLTLLGAFMARKG